MDERAMIAYQAYMSNVATLRDKRGRLVYPAFKDLFDYEKELKAVEKEGSEEKEESPMIARMRQFYKRKG